jgi:hypothetical protein
MVLEMVREMVMADISPLEANLKRGGKGMTPFQEFRLTIIFVIGLVIVLMIFDMWWHMWWKPYKKQKEWEGKRPKQNRRRLP